MIRKIRIFIKRLQIKWAIWRAKQAGLYDMAEHYTSQVIDDGEGET